MSGYFCRTLKNYVKRLLMKFQPSTLFLALILAIVAIIPASSTAQTVGISGSAITPNANSILELRSTDKGVLLPRMSTVERDAYTTSASLAAADKGMTLFNTTTDTYEYWNGTAWVAMGTAGDYDDDWTVVGVDVERQSGDVYIGDAASTNNDLYISDDIIDWDNSTFFLDPSSTSRINKIEFSDASASSPAILFEGDANSGLYQPADNEVGIVASGNERLRVVGSGVSIGGNSDAPNSLLDVVGGTSGAVTNLMTVRSDYTANNTGSAIRLINSTSATSDVGAEIQSLTTDAANGFSSLILRVHGSGGASGDLEERLRINGDGEMIVGSNGYRGKLTFYAEQGGTDYGVTFAANPATTQNVNYTLPPDDGDSDDVLGTDGSGILTWVDPSTLSDGDWAVSGVDQYSEVSGNVGIGATAPYSKLEVYDAAGPTITITKDGTDASAIFFRNGTGGGVNDGSTIGLNSAEHLDFTNSIADKDMFFNVNVGGTPTDVLFVDGGTGRIGINNTAPDYDLEVGGDAGIDNSLFHNGDTDTYMSFTTDRIQMFAGVGSSSPIIDIQETAGTDELTINEGGLLWDFRVEGGSDANLIFADGSADKVGIGMSSPTAKLEVQEEASADPFIVRVRRENSTAGDLSGIGLGVQASASVVKSGMIHERVNSNGAGKLHIVVDDSNDANDVTLAESRITINQSGNVGVGTTDPTNQLDVDGQIRMRTGATNGYIPVSDANGVMTWSDPTGLGLDVTTASNGLTETSNDIQLGGALSAATTITLGANNMVFNLDGLGEFDIQDGGSSAFFVQNDGNVGIGSSTPAHKLEVSGNAGIDGELVHNGDTHTNLTFTPDRIQFFAGHGSDSWIDMQHSAEEMAINEQGRSRDFRVEGDTDANLIMVDGSQDNVGIGGAPDPDIKLDVNGYSAATNQVTIIPLWQAGSTYAMSNTSGSDLSNCESGINPDIYEPNGNIEVKMVIRVTSTSGGTVGNFQLRTHNGTTETYPIVSGDSWTWASTQSGYVVTSPWKSWAAGTNAAEMHIHGWVNSGSSLNFNSAYLLVRAQQN